MVEDQLSQFSINVYFNSIRLFIKLCQWFPKVPFFLKMAFFVDLEVPFSSEITKTSVRLVVPFAKRTTNPHPHPHHPTNDEIRLINTSLPKIKKLELLDNFLFFTSILIGYYGNRHSKIKCSKLCGGDFWR